MSADDRSVFRVPLAAAPFQLPVIGTRLPNEDSTVHLSGLVRFFYLFGSFHSAEGNLQIGSMGVVFFRV